MMNSIAVRTFGSSTPMLSRTRAPVGIALADQAEQEVLGPDVGLADALRLILRQDEDLPRIVGEPVEMIQHPARRRQRDLRHQVAVAVTSHVRGRRFQTAPKAPEYESGP